MKEIFYDTLVNDKHWNLEVELEHDSYMQFALTKSTTHGDVYITYQVDRHSNKVQYLESGIEGLEIDINNDLAEAIIRFNSEHHEYLIDNTVRPDYESMIRG